MRRMGARARDARGQSTAEAAVALPVVFLLVLLLVQPGHRAVRPHGHGRCGGRGLPASGDERRRCGDLRGVRAPPLGGDPALDVFHVHDSGCTWEVRCEGGGAADVARVTVRTEVRPLPLLDGGATLLGMVNERGNLVVEVTATAPTRASWAQESLNGASVNGKAGEWRHEG